MPKLSAQLLLTITVFAAALLMQLRYYDVGLDLDREGVIVEGARQMRMGSLDYDALGVRSGRFMFEDLVLRAFGDQLTALRGWWALLRAATAAMIFYAVMVLAGAGVAFPIALVALLMPGPWTEVWTPFSAMLVIVALLYFRRKPRQSTALSTGVVLGLAIAEDPGTGFWLLPAALVAISRLVSAGKDRIYAPLFATLGAGVGLLVFGGWVRKIDWGAFVGDYLHALPSGAFFLPSMPVTLFLLPLAAAIVTTIGITVYFRRPPWLTGAGAADALAVSLIALAMLGSTIIRHEAGDILLNFAPALVLCGVIVGWGWRQAQHKSTRLAAALLGTWLALTTFSVAPLNDMQLGGPGLMRERSLRLDNEFAPMQVNAREKEILENLVRSIRETAPDTDDAIFVVPDAALLYAMADRLNVLPAPGVTRLTDAKLAAELTESPPQTIVLPAPTAPFAAAYPQTWAWLTAGYELQLFVTPFALATPKPAAAPVEAPQL